MSFGFSVGDFIGGVGVVVEIVQALREANGSSAKFKALCNEMRSFQLALTSVQRIVQPLQHAQQGSEMIHSLHELVNDCRTSIDDVLKATQEYHKHLGRSSTAMSPGFSLRIRGTAAKLRWLLIEDDMPLLTARVQSHASSINIALSAICSVRISNMLETQNMRDQAIQTKLNDLSHQVQDASSTVINTVTLGLRNQTVGILPADLLLNKLDTLASTTRTLQDEVAVRAAVEDDFRHKVTVLLISLENNMQGLLLANADLSSRFEQQTRNIIFTLEDCLGNVHHLSLALVTDWKELQTFLEMRFNRRPGWSLVRDKQYLISSGETGERLQQNRAWVDTVKPGGRLTMTVAFSIVPDRFQDFTQCPGCRLTDAQLQPHDTTCENCGLTFRAAVSGEIDDIRKPIVSYEFGETSTPRADVEEHFRIGDFRRVLIDVKPLPADSFNDLLDRFNAEQARNMEETTLAMDKAMAFWNPLMDFSLLKDATS